MDMNAQEALEKELLAERSKAADGVKHWNRIYVPILVILILFNISSGWQDFENGRHAMSWILDIGAVVILVWLIVDFYRTGVPMFLKRKPTKRAIDE